MKTQQVVIHLDQTPVYIDISSLGYRAQRIQRRRINYELTIYGWLMWGTIAAIVAILIAHGGTYHARQIEQMYANTNTVTVMK